MGKRAMWIVAGVVCAACGKTPAKPPVPSGPLAWDWWKTSSCPDGRTRVRDRP